MKFFEKNIWSLFYLITFFSTFIFLLISYDKWCEIKKDFYVENQNTSIVISNSTRSYFKQIDIIIELLGQQLLEDDNYKNKEKIKQLFQKMLSINNEIVAYALIDINGNYLVTHLNEPPENIPNVLTREASKETFLETLKTNKIVIGRTYNLTRTQIISIPVRKTFFDKNGKPLAVISIAIDVKNIGIFDNKFLNSNSQIINLLRDYDKYWQFYVEKKNEENLSEIYKTPISLESYNQIITQIEKNYKTSINDIKENETAISFLLEEKNTKNKYLISSQYIKEYNLWVNSYILYKEITKKFLHNFYIYLISFIFGLTIIWWLFKYIDNIQKLRQQQLEYKAEHDSLTQLPNRYYLLNKSNKWIETHSNFSLIFIDLDNFKIINDTYGHILGDSVLKKISLEIKNLINKDDLLIRQGGDEFIIFTKETSKISEYCAALLNSIMYPFEIGNKRIKISASLGVSNYPNDSRKIDDLITFADMALYKAKNKKNTFVIFTNEIKDSLKENLFIEKELKLALENNEFFLVYQPQIDFNKGFYGVETLLRWNNKELGLVPPDKFIPIAESMGMMPSIGDFIFETAFYEIKNLQDKISKKFQLSINISVQQFMDGNFSKKLLEKIEKYNLNPKKITLEITESIFIEDLNYLKFLLKELKELGFKISMDDFGTGYSSLSMLRKVPISELKIDKSFIDDILIDESARHMIKTIISIGKTLNYEIVLAEGVENLEQIELLHKFGCDIYQGYYYSKPLTINYLESYIKTIQ